MGTWGFLTHTVLFGLSSAVGNFVDTKSTLSHISFGSCNKHDKQQPLWKPIIASKPDAFIWLGDAVYADEGIPGFRKPVPILEMKKKYALQKSNPNYQALLKSVPRVLGTWDDHDYGTNNGGHSYADREASQNLFLDFIDEPKDSARRQRPGVYNAWTYGPLGKRVTIILLDVRYFKDAEPGSLLGEQQWSWFEKTLQTHSDSQLYVIGSGTQILAPNRPVGEKWSEYPSEKSRLVELLRSADLAGVSVLLSGDVHFAELNCAEAGLSHPLLELTSSGLTHAWGEMAEHKFVPKAMAYFARAVLFAMPSRYQLNNIAYQRNITHVHGANYYPFLNFGAIRIDWSTRNVDLAIHDQFGDVAFNHTFSFNKTAFHSHHITCVDKNPTYDFVAKHIARLTVLAVLAVIMLDCWLVVHLLYLAVTSLVSDDRKAKLA